MNNPPAQGIMATGRTIDHPRRRVRVAVDLAGAAYVIAVYLAVLTRGRLYVQLFHSRAIDGFWRRVVLTDVFHPAVSFAFALLGDITIDIAAAILATFLMFTQRARQRRDERE